MSKKLLVSATILLALTVLGTLLAMQGPPEPGQAPQGRPMGSPPIIGTITSVGVDRFEIKKPDGSAQTILVNDQTHYRQRQQDQQQELKLEDLKVGDHVFVRGAPNADKQVVAEGVNRVSEEMFQRFQSGNYGGPGAAGSARVVAKGAPAQETGRVEKSFPSTRIKSRCAAGRARR